MGGLLGGGFGGYNPFFPQRQQDPFQMLQQLFAQSNQQGFNQPQPPQFNGQAFMAQLFQALQPMIAEGFGLGLPNTPAGNTVDLGQGQDVSQGPAQTTNVPAGGAIGTDTSQGAGGGFQGDSLALLRQIQAQQQGGAGVSANLIQQAQGRDNGAAFNQSLRGQGFTPTNTGTGFTYTRPGENAFGQGAPAPSQAAGGFAPLAPPPATNDRSGIFGNPGGFTASLGGQQQKFGDTAAFLRRFSDMNR